MATSETDRKENRRNKRGRAYTDSKRDFTPPSLDENPEFVTSPPKQRGLTTGISTLFRRPESRDTRDKSPDSRIASSHPSAGNSPPESPLPSDGNGPRSQSRLFFFK
mmetsp:Transcript_97/g.138  ORF Transcript_97/g.138 Transcript_97/m.138 type:complete len:107 (+) Transcript_97:181-501(+)